MTDDAGSALARRLHIEAPVRVLTGRARARTTRPSPRWRSAPMPAASSAALFVSVANSRRAASSGGGSRSSPTACRSRRATCYLDPLTQTQVVIDELPRGDGRGRGAADGLRHDRRGRRADRPGRPAAGRRRRLGHRARATACSASCSSAPATSTSRTRSSLLPNVELYGATGEDYAEHHRARTSSTSSSSTASCRPSLPDKPILAIAPPRTSELGTVAGHARAARHRPPGAGRAAAARRRPDPRCTSPAPSGWSCRRGRARVHPGLGDGAAALRRRCATALPTAVLAFDLRQSDLPLQVAWPILVVQPRGRAARPRRQHARPGRARRARRARSCRPTAPACA